jgi:glycosyltransferase involved in cell wall biosynthesis
MMRSGTANVSVILPVRDRPALLRRAIRSVMRQTVRPAEIIVIDDGSAYPIQVCGNYRGTETRVITNQSPRGVAHARNRGIAAATYDLIAFLDSDDIWLPLKLQKQLASMTDESRVFYTGHYVHVGNRLAPSVSRRRHDNIHSDLLSGWCPSLTSSVLLSRESLGSSRFSESLRSLVDYDFWLELSTTLRFEGIAEPLVAVLQDAPGPRVSNDPAPRLAAITSVRTKWQSHAVAAGLLSEFLGYCDVLSARARIAAGARLWKEHRWREAATTLESLGGSSSPADVVTAVEYCVGRRLTTRLAEAYLYFRGNSVGASAFLNSGDHDEF